jgi:membrane protein DedA with SNARE-associated domain/membrane-associated phospholipid phosphatase
MDHIQPYLDYFTANPTWAIVIIFLIAFGEALLIIGLFVPSTVVLVGAGTLVGTGHLGFWPVMLATIIGAVVGDQISFWAGKLFGERLKNMWPLSRYPALVAKGEDFVRSHGGKSIAVGRFVPGVKAVVPGIVGMLNMSQPFFLFVNVTSGIVWGAAHVFPGILIGQGLALAGEFSGRLVFLLVILLVTMATLGWITRILAAGLLSPFLRRVQAVLARLAKAQGSRALFRLGRVMAPEHPRSARLLKAGLVLVIALAVFAFVITRVLTLENASNLDLSLHSLLREMRSAPADALMTSITLFGGGQVMFLVCLVLAAWLAVFRAWRASIGVLAAYGVTIAIATSLKLAVGRARPIDVSANGLDSLYSFPSTHAAATTVAFGLLAVVAGHAMGRWSRAIVMSVACMVMFLIGFTRIYLGVHWLSDVLGGVALAGLVVAIFAFVLEAYPARRIRPVGLIGVVLIAWFTFGSLYVAKNFEAAQAAYAPTKQEHHHAIADWSANLWRDLPRQRIDIAGRSIDAFHIQWLGALDGLKAAASALGYVEDRPWTWSRAMPYLDPNAPFDALAPRPLLHEGLPAVLTFVHPETPDGRGRERRLVLRAYATTHVIDGAVAKPVYLVSLLREVNEPRLSLFTFPRSEALRDGPELDALHKAIVATQSTRMLVENPPGKLPRYVLMVPQ